MSDTTTITPEERAKLISHVNSGYMTISGEGLKRALAALEQAEARVHELEGSLSSSISKQSEMADGIERVVKANHALADKAQKAEAENARLRERYDDAAEEVATRIAWLEIENARLTKMAAILSEWCAQLESGQTLEEIGLALSNGMACPEPWQYADEAARRAVAAGEETCQK